MLDSVSSGNGSCGFEAFGEPVLMQDCVAFENGEAGFRTSNGGKIADCIARFNDSMGIDGGYFSTITNCTVKHNPWGIFIGGSCHVTGNMCEGNGDGILAYEGRNEIDENHVLNVGTGIKLSATDPGLRNNLVTRNTAGNNETNYDIAADNRYGPIIDITAAGTAAVTGDSGPDTSTTTHPWANFSC
ncbi:MAG: hypothetical protein ABIR71_13255 [Chthoniobacterales bacterium]